MESNNIFLTGYAKLPKGITAAELYNVIAVALIVDKSTGVIVDAECSLVTNIAKDFFREIVIGKNIKNYEEIQNMFKEKYFGSAKKAVISALKICNEKYKQILDNCVEESDD